MAEKKQRKRKNYDLKRDAHQLNRVQVFGTVITTLLLGNYYWQATKYTNPRFANDVEVKKKQLKKKCKATIDHIFNRDVVEDIED